MSERSYHGATSRSPIAEELWLELEIAQWVHPMKDRSDDPSHHEQTLLPRSPHWDVVGPTDDVVVQRLPLPEHGVEVDFTDFRPHRSLCELGDGVLRVFNAVTRLQHTH